MNMKNWCASHLFKLTLRQRNQKAMPVLRYEIYEKWLIAHKWVKVFDDSQQLYTWRDPENKYNTCSLHYAIDLQMTRQIKALENNG